MEIAPSTEKKKPNYPTLLVAAVVATAALASCKQQLQRTAGKVTPVEPPHVTGGIK